jgi:hypothetical protein
MEIIMYKIRRTFITEFPKQTGESIIIKAHTQSWSDAESKLPRLPEVSIKIK